MRYRKFAISFYLIITIMTTFSAFSKSSKIKSPEFNYPQNVIKDAEKGLKDALDKGDGESAVKNLILTSLAQTMITQDNAQSVIERIDSVAGTQKDVVSKALLYHFEAKMLYQYYECNSYAVGSRRTVEGTADMSEWSKVQFLTQIRNLIKKSLSDTEALTNRKIETMKDLITYNEYSHILYPTIFDLVCWNSLDMLKDYNFNGDDAARKLIDEIYESLKSVHKEDVAPYIFACKAQLSQSDADRNKKLRDLYQKYLPVSDMAYFAIDGYDGYVELEGRKLRHSVYKDFLSRYPKSIFADAVSLQIAELERGKINISLPNRSASTDSIKVNCNVTNVNKFKVYLFRVCDNALKSRNEKFLNGIELVDVKAVNIDSTGLFENTSIVEFKPQPYGTYFVFGDVSNKPGIEIFKELKREKYWYHWEDTKFIVSDIMLFSATTNTKKLRLFAVDATTGKPQKGVTLSFKRQNLTFETDETGSVSLKERLLPYFSSEVMAVRGKDKYTSIYTYLNGYDKDVEDVSAKIFTDLGVYKPGEKINYSLICYSIGPSTKMELKPNTKVVVRFTDSNYKIIDTLRTVTDDMGQVNSSFTVPKDRMNGTFSIAVFDEDDDDLGTAYIEVSEYKTPTFYVETSEKKIFEKGKDVVITGKAMTYIGLPVANAKLEAELTSHEFFWWRYWRNFDVERIATYHLETDEKGEFSLTIAADEFKSADDEFLQYALDISVTSAVGETQSATKDFILGNTCRIIATSQEIDDININADKNRSLLPITVESSDGNTKIECNYTISDNDGKNVISSGKFLSDSPEISLKDVKSGHYKLSISAIYGAEFTQDINIFRSDDKMPPVESPLWLPACEQMVDGDNNANILLGNTNSESYVYCMATSRDGVVSDGWMKFKPGIHKLKLAIPKKEYDFLRVKFIATYQGETYTKSLNFESNYKQNVISIKPVVFRDKLIPGNKEKWSFKLEKANGELAQGAMICEMYDKALNQIAANTWSFMPLPRDYSTDYMSVFNGHSQYRSYLQNLLGKRGKTVNVELPELYLYGVSAFRPNAMYKLQGRVLGLELREYDSAPVLMECADASIAEDNGLEASKDMEEMDTAEPNLEKVKMRTADIKTALWRPALRTDSEGNIYVEFDAPEFNTTWQMQALAFTGDLHTSLLKKDVVTSKPIMVRANAPRFLRQGDSTVLAASLMNATDEEQNCNAVIELFDIVTGEIIAKNNYKEILNPKETKPLTIEWQVPDTISNIGFRVKAATNAFGDGEQAAIVILPSISPVIETIPFYIDANQNQFSLELPKFPKGGRITLEFCENPVWYCVTALPSIKTDDYMTSSALAHSLYAITLAEGIATSYPRVRDAVNYWTTHNEDSTLISNLEKNGDLKIGTLLASPWINEASRQTLRMKSISDLFDPQLMSAEKDKVISKLQELQMSDGGWTWFKHPDCRSQLYVTGEVLELIGELRHLGYAKNDDSLENMLKKAIPYFDKKTVEEFEKQKGKKGYASLTSYVYVRSLYKDFPLPQKSKDLYNKALNAMKDSWKGKSHIDKAYISLALFRNGHKTVAKNIIESLRQFSMTKPGLGMYWDNLNIGWNRFYNKTTLTSVILQAMAEIEPNSTDIDQIRKWLLLDKQAKDWGNSSMASEAVYAILSTGSKWLGEQQPSEISISDLKIEGSQTDKFVGYLKQNVDLKEAEESVLKIGRNASNPAWGAIYCQYSAPMSEIKSAKTDYLSIEKQIYLVDGENLKNVNNAKVGNRVQVRLVIKNTRDLEFVTLNDERPSCAEPVDQLSEYKSVDGMWFCQEIKNDVTRIFFDYMPKGTHVITYDMHITSPGDYNAGIATIQSQYAPQITAHSKGIHLTTIE